MLRKGDLLVEKSIGLNDAGQRADRYLRKLLPGMSLGRVQSLFRKKEVKVDRKPIPPTYVLREGECFQAFGIRLEETREEEGRVESTLPFSGLEIPILHEDADLLILDKPANLAVHPGTGIEPGGSVIEKVRDYLKANSGWEGDTFAPSLVHRLDRDTSGVLVVAKSAEALRSLASSMRVGGFQKEYLTLVEGVPQPEKGTVAVDLLRTDSRTGGAKSLTGSGSGREAVTHYQVSRKVGSSALLSVIIETGRMHQIRAHMAHLGHPILGDDRYGSYERNRFVRKNYGLRRIFLHAHRLRFPWRGGICRFESPLAEDLRSCMRMMDDATMNAIA